MLSYSHRGGGPREGGWGRRNVWGGPAKKIKSPSSSVLHPQRHLKQGVPLACSRPRYIVCTEYYVGLPGAPTTMYHRFWRRMVAPGFGDEANRMRRSHVLFVHIAPYYGGVLHKVFSGAPPSPDRPHVCVQKMCLPGPGGGGACLCVGLGLMREFGWVWCPPLVSSRIRHLPMVVEGKGRGKKRIGRTRAGITCMAFDESNPVVLCVIITK